MASKLEEDPEEGDKPVAECLVRNEEIVDKCVTEQVTDNKNREKASKLSGNSQVVDKVIDNFSGDESESETFQDAVADFGLSTEMDFCATTALEGEKNGDVPVEEEKGKDEEEEKLTPEEKEVC